MALKQLLIGKRISEARAQLDKLMQTARVWKLECNMEPEAAHVSYNAMKGN